jgi:hypothetical protein
VQLRTSLILSFKSLHERTLGERVPLLRVKSMSVEQAQALFSAPADQLLSGEQIGLVGQLEQSISRLENHILQTAGSGRAFKESRNCLARPTMFSALARERVCHRDNRKGPD